ncbi:MAG TPA: N-acetylmuramoyl-L-alanine amidase, partial [Thermoanaerobaculia bacterium]|nr:N-acetylmuramoyl-L-alanine amidase [Thermoanaerobaculia bacterium]
QSQALAAGTTYFWRVQGWNTSGTQGNYSSIRNFTTLSSLLPAPSLTAPSDGATGVSTTPAFSWSSVSGANRYWLTVATNSGTLPTDPNATSCPGCVITCSVTSTSHTAGGSCSSGQSQALAAGTTYFWRVQGWNTSGTQGNYSSIRNFTTTGQSNPDIRIEPLSLTFGSATLDFGGIAELSEPAPTTDVVPVELVPGTYAYLSALTIDSGTLRLSNDTAEGFAESQPLAATRSFSALGAKWEASSMDSNLELSVRYSTDGEIWSSWLPLEIDDHLSDPSKSLYFSRLISTSKDARFVQHAVRIRKNSSDPGAILRSLAFVLIDPGTTSESLLHRLQVAPQPVRLSRTNWGCPDGQNSPLWAPVQTSVTHLIIHHTDTTNTSSDWPAQVRSIWSYHTYGRGWGDIGYNYLIDPTGVIYEGRAGGDDVIGAHFLCQNQHTQGIALLGTYTSSSPTAQALQGLKTLLAWLASRGGVDPLGSSFHSGTDIIINNISGHRDGNPSPNACSTTTCPGENLYGSLPDIRADVADLLSGATGQTFTIYNDGSSTLSVTSIQLQTPGSWIQWAPQAPFSVPPGSSREVAVTVDLNSAPPGDSTRRLLVTSNDPDESPYPNAVNVNVHTPSVPACFLLTRSHTGSGSDPVASPSSSSGCPAGQYVDGASIDLTASPAPNWTVGGWTGTVDNASHSSMNIVVMTASNRTVTVNYVAGPPPVCYMLTSAHTGSGGDPIPSSGSSPDCEAGHYSAGESVQVTASPSPGWRVNGWDGTVDNSSASNSNTVVVNSDQTVAVAYIQAPPDCFTLSRTHSGSGADPAAWPANSPECLPDSYVAGTEIQLTASPSSGWAVGGWSGSSDDSSTSVANTTIMPSSNHVVSIMYTQGQSQGWRFYTLPPCRTLDTRSGPPPFSGGVYQAHIAGHCGVPSTAEAVAANISAVGPTGPGFVTVWPANLSSPGTSTINFGLGQTRTNNAILRLSTDGTGDIRYSPAVIGNGSVHLIIDVSGYFMP